MNLSNAAKVGDIIKYSLGREHGDLAGDYECEVEAVLTKDKAYGVYVSYGQDIVPFDQAEIIKRK